MTIPASLMRVDYLEIPEYVVNHPSFRNIWLAISLTHHNSGIYVKDLTHPTTIPEYGTPPHLNVGAIDDVRPKDSVSPSYTHAQRLSLSPSLSLSCHLRTVENPIESTWSFGLCVCVYIYTLYRSEGFPNKTFGSWA